VAVYWKQSCVGRIRPQKDFYSEAGQNYHATDYFIDDKALLWMSNTD